MLTLLLNFNADQVLIFLSELLRKIIDSKYLLNVYYLLMKIPLQRFVDLNLQNRSLLLHIDV